MEHLLNVYNFMLLHYSIAETKIWLWEHIQICGEHELKKFLTFFKSIHQNIKFTMDIEKWLIAIPGCVGEQASGWNTGLHSIQEINSHKPLPPYQVQPSSSTKKGCLINTDWMGQGHV